MVGNHLGEWIEATRHWVGLLAGPPSIGTCRFMRRMIIEHGENIYSWPMVMTRKSHGYKGKCPSPGKLEDK